MKNFKIKSYLRKFTDSPPLPIFLIFTFFLHSCATPTLRQTARNIRKEIKSGNYEKALNVVLKEPTFKEKKTSLLFHMEQGLLYHLMNKTEKDEMLLLRYSSYFVMIEKLSLQFYGYI